MTSATFLTDFLDNGDPQLHTLLYLLVIWLAYRYRLLHAAWRLADAVVGAKLRRVLAWSQARRAELKGEWIFAGRIQEELGDFSRALGCYEKGKDFRRCGEICLELGRMYHAAEWFVLAGDHRRAAELHMEAGRFGRAACSYLEAGADLSAASAFMKAGDALRAAEIYAEQGAIRYAGEAFEKAQCHEQAGECFEWELVGVGDLNELTLTVSERKTAVHLSLRAADCFRKAGKLDRAMEVLAKGHQYSSAASVAEEQGAFREAAALYEKAGDLEKAYQMLVYVGDVQSAQRLEGVSLLAGGSARRRESSRGSRHPVSGADGMRGSR